MTEPQSQEHRANPVDVPGSLTPVGVPLPAIIVAGFVVVLTATAWLTSLEISLPDIRMPANNVSSTALPGHELMMPGTTTIEAVDPELEGDWVSQEIGEMDWIATDLQGSRMRAAFYGTDISMMVRMGPDASRAYVRVNDEPVDHLSEDELGSYVNLWAGETSDQPVTLARNLAHGEHVIEIIADGDGELAVSGFNVTATTPFSWAFVLGYLGLGGGLFLLTRSMLYAINKQSSRPQSPASNAKQEQNQGDNAG